MVAIDFGTRYSGFAFAFNHKKGEGGIHMNRAWGHDQGTATLKTPTSLLLHPDGSFDSFGYEAEEKYANFLDGEDRDYLYFKHFKMALHKSEVMLIHSSFFLPFAFFFLPRLSETDYLRQIVTRGRKRLNYCRLPRQIP